MSTNQQNIFSIEHLHIENFRAIKYFDSDFSNSLNLIVGINGAGKSTILHAIEILFSWFAARIRNPKGNGVTLRNEDITNGKSQCILEVTLKNGTSWTIFKQRSTSRKKTDNRSNFTVMTSYINDILIHNEDSPQEEFLPLFSSYGVNRCVDETPGRLRKDNALSCFDVYNRDLSKQLNYRSFFRWFNEREIIEDKEYRYNQNNFRPDNQLTAVREAIRSILPGYDNLHVKSSPHTFVIKKDGNELLFDQLSDGEKALIALVGDIARKLAMAHPNSQNPLKESAILVIDEIDLHLHPSWQRDVLPRMRSVFPECQLIVSTHSPFVLTNISSNRGEHLFLMKNGEATFVESNIFGRQITNIIPEILEMSSLRNEETQKHLTVVFDCLKRGDSTSFEFKENFEWLQVNIDNSDILFMDIALQQKINALKK